MYPFNNASIIVAQLNKYIDKQALAFAIQTIRDALKHRALTVEDMFEVYL